VTSIDSGIDDDYASYGMALADAVDSRFVDWLTSTVATRFPTGFSDADHPRVLTAIDDARVEAQRLLHELAQAPVTEPLSGPLERIRQAVHPIAEVLDEAGASRPRRDPVDAEMRPDDVYAIGPHSFIDLGDDVHAAGIQWGAAKAYVHMQRRQNGDGSG